MEIFAGFMGFVLIILIIMALFIPLFVYLAQKWAFKSYEQLKIANTELKKMNEKLELIKKRS